MILLRGGLLLLGCSLAVGFAEVLLRLLGVSFPAPYIPDEYTGTRLRPGLSAWFTKEGLAFVTINNDGFRDRQHARDKPANTYRILVLGDSYVEAVQVSQQETFWGVLEKQLQPSFHRHGKQVEVIAMGVSGWGTAQQYQALEHYGFAYHPDVVVLAFLAGNDLRNNSRQLEGDPGRPYFVLDNGNLRLDDSFRNDPQFLTASSRLTAFKVALINHSRLLQLIQESRARWKYSAQIRQAGASAGLDESCFLEPTTDAWKDAWTVTERLIQRMQDECQKHAARFCVMTVTDAIQVHPDAAQREAFRRRLDVEDLGYSDRRIRQLGERLGFSVVELAKPLCEYAERRNEFLHGFANTKWGEGHWNATGHRLAGEVLAQKLTTELLEGAAASSSRK